jgi:dTDP-4-dehydrorhamnose reductase
MPGILLLGGSGRLGTAVSNVFDQVDAPSSSELNLRDGDALARRIDELEPAAIINCAGLTDVDGCDRDPQAADELNGYAPGRLALRARQAGVPLVHISTDYVFSGDDEGLLSEDQALAPVNRYGQSKSRGEGLVLDSGALALVARVQWLFGGPKGDFVRFVRSRLLAGAEVPVVRDQIGVPSFTSDLAVQLEAVMNANVRGVIHLGNTGEVSREDQAAQIASDLGVAGTFRLVTWAELGRTAPRPRRSVLDTTRIRDLVASLPAGSKLMISDWHQAQVRYLAELIEEHENG